MIAGILAFLASAKTWPWGIIWRVALVLSILGALYFFGRYLYALGVSDENGRWEERVETLERKTEEIAEDAEREHRQITERINRTLAAETEQLESVAHADDFTFLSTYAAADRRLRDSADAGGD